MSLRLVLVHDGEIGVLPITLAPIAKALALNSIPLGNARQLLDECIIGWMAASIMLGVAAFSSRPTDCNNLRPMSSIVSHLEKSLAETRLASMGTSRAISSPYFTGLSCRIC